MDIPHRRCWPGEGECTPPFQTEPADLYQGPGGDFADPVDVVKLVAAWFARRTSSSPPDSCGRPRAGRERDPGDRVENTETSGVRSSIRVHAPGVSPSLAELREGAANVIAAVLVKARGRELTDSNELEKALRASSAVVDAVAEYISALAQAERREALEGR